MAISPWRCLDCGAVLDSQSDKCDLCKTTIEEQSSGPDIWAMALGRDLAHDLDDDQYRACAQRTKHHNEQLRLRAWQDDLMRRS